MHQISALHSFNQDTKELPLPEKFTYPFYYEAHPLAKLAAQQTQDFLNQHYDNEHNFGIDPEHEGIVIGKMFGVLVVKTLDHQLGFLAAYSGKLAEGKQHPFFVPPVYDVFKENGLFRKEEANIVALNLQIDSLELNEDFLRANENLKRCRNAYTEAVSQLKHKHKQQKKARDLQRQKATDLQNSAEQNALLKILNQESINEKFELRSLVKIHKGLMESAEKEVEQWEETISKLKEERKNRSAQLQAKLFDEYTFLNAHKAQKSLLSIFTHELGLVPPAGAGECAAPKLLQYAYQNHLKPIAMAEFWWGQSPKSEIRKHGEYYPACRGKCGPILGFMLQGLDTDPNPMAENTAEGKTIEILYEDEALVVINKPAEFLSVPGKLVTDSVQTRMQQLYPGSMPVHRLDQSTSGIMLIARNFDFYVKLQSQFIKRTVEKKYMALLDGIVAQNSGKIELPLRVDLDDRPRQMVCYEHGKSAITTFEVKERKAGKTLIGFSPHTGRTHQLRVHAAHIAGLNAPIVGDDLYGKKSNRLHLHAHQLSFNHPISNERVSFSCEPDFTS